MTRTANSTLCRQLLVLALVLMLALVAIPMTAPRAAAANSPGRPTLLIHGIAPWDSITPSTDCNAQLGALAHDMSAALSRNVITVGYYTNDTNCSFDLHANARARGADYGDSDSYKEIAKALSWYIFLSFTQRGAKVDLIGYSLGGVIARGAVYGAQIREPGFSPPIDVGNAVTLGAPFDGAYVGCLWGQCASITQNSKDLRWLNQSCDAQGTQSTLWTIFGSSDDGVVPADSATHMCTWGDRKFVLNYVDHSGPNSYVGLSWVIRLVRASVGGQTSRIASGYAPNRCLDVRYMSTNYGTPVESYDCNTTLAQVWTRQASGQLTQITALGMCLDRARAGTAPGTLVQLWGCNGSLGQQWTQYSDRTIRSANMCLAAPNNNWSNFTQLEIWTCNGGPGELWS